MLIVATKKNIGRHRVGVPFKASRRDARIYIACNLAKEHKHEEKPEEPKPAKKKATKKRAYNRRDMTAEKPDE